MTDWEKLRRRIRREHQKHTDGRFDGRPATNRAEREMAASFQAAYTSVLWMMDRIEATK